MEPTSAIPSSHQPVRSVSLPTRIHPSSHRVQALLNHLKPSQERSISSNLETETIQNDLVFLSELYKCMEEFLQPSQTQQALLKYQQGKMVEEALCGSVTLLDACGAARDLLLVLREHLQTLQSAIRRRRGDSTVESSISAYVSFRKKAKKEIARQLGALKRMEIKAVSPLSEIGQDQNLIFVARVLKEAGSVTVSVLRSLMVFFSTLRLKTKESSLIPKLKASRLFSLDKGQRNTNEVAVCSLVGKGRSNEAQTVLEGLIEGMSCMEGGLDSVSRCLIKQRVYFLNMLSH